MKNLLLCITMLVSGVAFAQNDPLVLQQSGMDKIQVKSAVVFKTLKDTILNLNLYYPPEATATSNLPTVIFCNGVGIRELPDWRIYQDWARFVALHGMIGVTYQTRRGKSLKDSEDLIDYLRTHASELRIDKEKLALWSCSANVGTALPLAGQPGRNYIKALVMYYGFGGQAATDFKRQDLDILLVRAGLDFYNLNNGINTFIKKALDADAHIQVINYPEGQHAFDMLDNTEPSRVIIRQTASFLKEKLSKGYPVTQPFVLTNQLLWKLVIVDKEIDKAIAEFKKAIVTYRGLEHTPWFNHVIDERNLNQMGYQLLDSSRYQDAIRIFRANAEAFPESPNAYDALGDAFEKIGDKDNALRNSQLALEKLKWADGLNPDVKKRIQESATAKINRLSK